MTMVAHDENSLTNLLFSELHRHSLIHRFLEAITWRGYPSLPFHVASVEVHQQLNFSEFGKPDVLLLVTDPNETKHAIIVEVKLGTYLSSCGYNLDDGKFNHKNNSKLNNQLTLRYRFMRALPTLKARGYVAEAKHLPESPYSRDLARRCKKPKTCEFFSALLETPLDFYLVTLTADSGIFLNTVVPGHQFHPLFYDSSQTAMDNFHNLGSITWNDCNKLLRDADNHFCGSFQKLWTAEQQEDPLSSTDQENKLIKGRQVVMYMGQPCLLTRKQYSYKIRGLLGGQFVVLDQGTNDRQKYLAMQGRIAMVGQAPRKGVEDGMFWTNYLSCLNGNVETGTEEKNR